MPGAVKQLCGSRSTTGMILRLYYPEGEYFMGTGGIALYYAQDQIGSVRDLTAVRNGTIIDRSVYDYDAYGNLTKNSGRSTADFGYAGMLYEPNSGLDLTLDRAYSPRLMRWLSRDQVGAQPTPNLYLYRDGNPVPSCDPAARDCQSSPLSLIGLTLSPAGTGTSSAASSNLVIVAAPNAVRKTTSTAPKR